MFDRISYKRAAWNQYQSQIGVPVLATFLFFALIFVLVGICFFANTMRASHLAPIFILAFLSAFGIFKIVISYITLKMTRTNEKIPADDIRIALKDYWQDGILGALWSGIFIFLWGFLFVIPGIVKTISYSMMFFVLVENPGISVRKALSISKIMTEGHKMDLFIAELSLLGWNILAFFTGTIGYVFLLPYRNLIYANAYNELKRLAFQDGKLTPADFFVIAEK